MMYLDLNSQLTRVSFSRRTNLAIPLLSLFIWRELPLLSPSNHLVVFPLTRSIPLAPTPSLLWKAL